MQEFKKRQPKIHYTLRFFLALMGSLLLFVLSGVAVSSAWGMYGTFKVATEGREGTESKLASMQSDQVRIGAAVASFDSPQGVEKQVRERFGVAKPDEGEIQIVRDASAQDAEPSQKQNIFVQLFHSLFVW